MMNNPGLRKRILLSAFMLLLLVSGFFHFFGLPAYRGYVQSGEELRELINGQQKKQAGEERIQREIAQLNSVRANWEALRKEYKTGVDRGAFVVYLGLLAGGKIKITEIKAYPAAQKKGIIIQPYSMMVSGGFADIIEAVRELEQGIYCVDVMNIKFELPEGDTAAGVENINAAGENIAISGAGEIPRVGTSVTGNSVLAGVALDVYFLPDERNAGVALQTGN